QGLLYTADRNLFMMSLTTQAITQLTDFRNGKEPRDKKKTEQDKWLQHDELSLIGILAERKMKEDSSKAIDKLDAVKRPKTFYLDGRTVFGLQLSADRQYITFALRKNPPDENRAQVPNYVTESSYAEMINTRTKVGSEQAEQEVGIYNISKDTIYFVKPKDLPGLDQQLEFTKDYGDKKQPAREVVAQAPSWSGDGKHVVLSFRSKDNKERWICLLDPATATYTVLNHEHDEAWIAGPGISGSPYFGGAIEWMPDNTSVWFQSEASGYSHLYTLNVVTKQKTALTSGKFEVYNPRLSNDKKFWYLEANKDHPGKRHLYYMPVQGGPLTQITDMTGGYETHLSPDEKKIAFLYSYMNKPWELYVMDNPRFGKKSAATKVTQSTTKEFNAYPWRTPEVVTFKARDGEDVYARLYKPADAQPNGPAVVFVHGAGYLQNAHYWWSSYFHEYMFHNLLADKGYTVLDIDYRGSAGYGRDVRTAIYRHMGGKDLSDQVDGARYLAAQHQVDAKRIGIYGGSYGGFITLMAMFTEPDVFAAGAALRSVTDWAHYNHGYTSNILNTPVADSLAYRKSSPIYHAEGLKGALLICHGMIDTNVHFQDVVRLAQRLIELKKENWEFAVYPLENHGFVEPSSWTDEYRRILKLFDDNLRK
ncbi:MAG: prolyl oligopeptidase family serine peptidase, partial [Bacteroidia bacterium]|nr:prolyl oligopeptidase family serine peptidase [Bacteroidia bacterium]